MGGKGGVDRATAANSGQLEAMARAPEAHTARPFPTML